MAIDPAALDRAAPGAPPPGAAPAPEQGGVEIVATELEGTKQMIEDQVSQGNPAAAQALQDLQVLVQSLSAMAGGGAPAGPPAGVAGPNQGVPLETGVPL